MWFRVQSLGAMTGPKVNPAYYEIVEHYEKCLETHGDTYLGVDWPNKEDAATRYKIMLGVIAEPAPRPLKLLDFGCGAGHLLEFIEAEKLNHIDYIGLDISPKFIALCRSKWPERDFIETDILIDQNQLPRVDYLVMNGVFTEKRGLAYGKMFEYMRNVMRIAWPSVGKGMAVNVMSKSVDWERNDLFHLGKTEFAAFIKRDLSTHLKFYLDYGLYEYTAYIYRDHPKTCPAKPAQLGRFTG